MPVFELDRDVPTIVRISDVDQRAIDILRVKLARLFKCCTTVAPLVEEKSIELLLAEKYAADQGSYSPPTPLSFEDEGDLNKALSHSHPWGNNRILGL